MSSVGTRPISSPVSSSIAQCRASAQQARKTERIVRIEAESDEPRRHRGMVSAWSTRHVKCSREGAQVGEQALARCLSGESGFGCEVVSVVWAR